MNKIPALHQQILDQAKSSALGRYVWDCGVGPQMGYSFSVIHALAYSFIGFQGAFISTKWNPIYWDTACLVVNSGSLEEEDTTEEIVSIYEVEDPDYIYEDLPDRSAKKKKAKNTDYTKMAKAIGSILDQNISISLININTSDYGFKPDIENNRILYGLKALSNVNKETTEMIKAGRLYHGISDFLSRCKLNKVVMVNLIKAGAFDEIDTEFGGDRKKIMAYYLMKVSEPKTKLNLQNFNGLIQKDLVPKELELQLRVYNFNKFLKTRKVGKYYTFDNSCIQFIEKFLTPEMDKVQVINGIYCMLQDTWDKIYQKKMDPAREWLKKDQQKVLKEYNRLLFKELWDKYAQGSLSRWEMDSLCFYYGPHELIDVDNYKYGLVDFNSLNPESAIETFFVRGKNKIPIYKLSRIAGTVIAKNDTKSIVTILTTTGVVDVKFSREYYAMFKKQISELDPTTGKKHVVEKGWFTRGTMIMVTGFRREDTFVGKTYKSTNSHQLYKITEVIGNELRLQHERYTSADCIEEDEYE